MAGIEGKDQSRQVAQAVIRATVAKHTLVVLTLGSWGVAGQLVLPSGASEECRDD